MLGRATAWLMGGWLIVAASLLGACGPAEDGATVVDEAAYAASVEAWQAERTAEVRAADGWLSLVGLFWIGDGAHHFGSDASNALVFPPPAPPRLGTLHVAGDSLRVEVAAGETVTHEGQRVTRLALRSDADGAPTVLAYGPLQWFVITRDGRHAVRVRDTTRAEQVGFTGVPSYEIDSRWRIAGRFEAFTPPRTLVVPTVMGTPSEQASPGAVVFEVDGETHRLGVIGAPGDDEYFVIFGDPTNGETTYAAGRYLYIDAPGPDGSVVIDFNKAYNPPCVFTPYATCPFPPPENRLPFAVLAGEQTYEKPPEG